MSNRYISAQVLLNSDGSLKAQRVYAIPMPSVVSFYLQAVQEAPNGGQENVIIGVMVQDWNSRDILDNHPNFDVLMKTLQKHFGVYWGWKTDAK